MARHYRYYLRIKNSTERAAEFDEMVSKQGEISQAIAKNDLRIMQNSGLGEKGAKELLLQVYKYLAKKKAKDE